MKAEGTPQRDDSEWSRGIATREMACPIWQREGGCLAGPPDAVPADELLTGSDISIAAHSLAGLLRERCKLSCSARQCLACPPLVALEQLLRLMSEGGVRQIPRGDAQGKAQPRLSLSDLVRRAVGFQDPSVQDVLRVRLTQVLADVCRSRLAAPRSPDAGAYF